MLLELVILVDQVLRIEHDGEERRTTTPEKSRLSPFFPFIRPYYSETYPLLLTDVTVQSSRQGLHTADF